MLAVALAVVVVTLIGYAIRRRRRGRGRIVGMRLNTPAPADEAPPRLETASEPPSNLISFTVFAPRAVKPSSSFVLTVWLSLDPSDRSAAPGAAAAQREDLLRRAGGSGRMVEAGSRGPVRVPLSSELALTLELDGFDIAEGSETVRWEGALANAGFIVRAPDLAPGTYPGIVRATRAGMLVARVVFEILVDAAAPSELGHSIKLNARQTTIRSAFASYASADREAVLSRVQGIRATGIDVFVDLLSLRAGDRWERELRRAIRERDVLYLFWSPAARASEWVEREWRLALEHRGSDFIWPIPLADPRDAPPPEDLRNLHFNDDILAHIDVERLRNEPREFEPVGPRPSAASSPPEAAPRPQELAGRNGRSAVTAIASAALIAGLGTSFVVSQRSARTAPTPTTAAVSTQPPVDGDALEVARFRALTRGADPGEPAITFSPGSSRLDDDARSDIARLASRLQPTAARGRVVVIGFGDGGSDVAANARLALDRARAVAAALAAGGVDARSTDGFGTVRAVGGEAGAATLLRTVEVYSLPSSPGE